MIKKSLSALALAICAASNSHAAIESGNPYDGIPGPDSSVILALVDFAGDGSYLIDITQQAGVTQDQLRVGNGFEYSLSSSAQAFVAGATALRWAMFSISGEDGPYETYTTAPPYYYIYDNVDPDLGLVYTSDDAPLGVGNSDVLRHQLLTVNSWIRDMNIAGIADTGEIQVANGAPADGDTAGRIALGGGLFSTGLTHVFYEKTQSVVDVGFIAGCCGSIPTAVNQLGMQANLANGNQFVVSNLSAPAVPVPATAWLFGSALLGLTGLKNE